MDATPHRVTMTRQLEPPLQGGPVDARGKARIGPSSHPLRVSLSPEPGHPGLRDLAGVGRFLYHMGPIAGPVCAAVLGA